MVSAVHAELIESCVLILYSYSTDMNLHYAKQGFIAGQTTIYFRYDQICHIFITVAHRAIDLVVLKRFRF